MHPKYERAHYLSKEVIGAAINVHRIIGPGLIESIYEKCMMHELQLRKIPFVNQARIPLKYKGAQFEEYLKFDIYVDDCLMVELKAVEATLPVHKAQMLSYMKLLNAPVGLLINFHSQLLKQGFARLILPGADGSSM